MANTTFNGPVRSENGFQEWNGSTWVPIGGGGGGGTTTITLATDVNGNAYSDDYNIDPPTGPTAGNIIQLPPIEVGQTYTIMTGPVSGSLLAWAIQLPVISGVDLSSFIGDWQMPTTFGDGPAYNVNIRVTGLNEPSDTIYIYGFLVAPMQIMRMPDVVVPGFGTVAMYTQIIPGLLSGVTPFPDPIAYPYTQLITP